MDADQLRHLYTEHPAQFWEWLWRETAPEPNSGCWIWLGATNRGYARSLRPHRYIHEVLYEIIRGMIPEKLELDHLCRVTFCVNPFHLEAVTHRVNVMRGDGIAVFRKNQTHCVNGHPFDQENTYWKPARDGERRLRQCRRCTIDKKRERRHALQRAGLPYS